jgi:hypothetical protein
MSSPPSGSYVSLMTNGSLPKGVRSSPYFSSGLEQRPSQLQHYSGGNSRISGSRAA